MLLADAGYWHQQQMEHIIERDMLTDTDTSRSLEQAGPPRSDTRAGHERGRQAGSVAGSRSR